MKREGRQHGTVRTLCILSPNPLNPSKPAQRKSSPALGSPPTNGVFTRVSTRPTNHSKPTGKCGRPRCTDCHLHPAWKSKDKIKGARKLRATDIDMGYGGLLAWRVMGKAAQDQWCPDYKMKLGAYSAREILDEFVSHDSDHDDYYSFHDSYLSFNDYRNSRYSRRTYDDDNNNVNVVSMNLDSLVEYPFISSPSSRAATEINEEGDAESANGSSEMDVVEYGDGDEDDDDDMGFFDVAIVWEAIDGDEGWALIGEM